MREVFKVNKTRAQASSHTPRRKKAIALLLYEYDSTPFTKQEANLTLSREGLLEGSSFSSLWTDLTFAGFVQRAK